MRDTNQLTDVRLIARNGTSLYVHRAVVSSTSVLFRSLFRNNFLDKEYTNQATVYFPEVSEETLRLISDFSYGLDISLDDCDIPELLNWVGYLRMPELFTYSVEWIAKQFSFDNCLKFVRLATLYKAVELKSKILRFVCNNFEEVWLKSRADFLTLSFDDLLAILSDDRTNIRYERLAWLVIKQWIKHVPGERKKFFKRLFMTLRLTLLDPCTFDEILDNEMVENDEECMSLMHAAYAMVRGIQLQNNEIMSLLEGNACVPRLPYEVVFTTGGKAAHVVRGTMQVYDPRAEKWHELESWDKAGFRAYHGSISVGSSLFNIGGYNGNDYLSLVSVFDLSEKSWSYRAAMNAKRCYVAVAEYHGQMYAFGGMDGRHRLHTVERYHPESNQWSYVHCMNSPRSDAHAVTVGDKIFVVGGFDGFNFMSTVECYDPAVDRWTEASRMTRQRSGVGRYDPRTKMWQELAPMRQRRSNFGIAVVENQMLVAGGLNMLHAMKTCEIYEPRMDRWRHLPPLLKASCALSCVVFKELPNVENFLKTPRQPKRSLIYPWDFPWHLHREANNGT
ncbi:unnamed protein product [Soboliphyme baturini]|uniref:BTB domain-containing protein n=1 Tax=Soboliphyme baturini TaxID=241478 RepID=A0A183IWY5_9BILA|nr:unnamed protein product [Soboliphyme baturini]